MKILIVDDNPDDRKLLRYMIERNRHEAIEAEDGFDGVKKAKTVAPDLIISDALMPVMDGFQFLREVKQDAALRQVPFIFYSSSYKEYQDVRLAMSLGADAYFIKPVDPVELWGKIESLLAGGRKVSSSPVELVQEDAEYLKRYSEVVATKLEEKVRELELALDERRRAEEALRESNAFIHNILESVGEGFIVVDRDYRIISANRAFRDMVNAESDQIVGKLCYAVAHKAVKPCFENGEECPVKRTFETRVPHFVTHIHTDDAGAKQYVEIKSYPFLDESGEVKTVIETVNDVTERKKLEDQLRQAQKMEAIGTLAGGVAHDFNNILTAIMGYGHIVKMKMSPDDPQRSMMDQILLSSERAAHLTQGLLAFSRKQVIKPKPVDLNEVIKSIEKLLRRLIGEDVELTTAFGAESLVIMADAGQLEQVLMNLATNARDAMPNGGLLSIATQVVDVAEDFAASHGLGRPGKYALVTVSDTGIGMDAPTREKIFEPFFTTKEVGKGTGLGLAIVYGIIRQHEASIGVYSEQGKGTTFKLYFPLIVPEGKEEVAHAAAAPVGGSETILIAEDDENVRKLMHDVLTGYGYHVFEAIDGEDAVAQFNAHAAEIQLLLLDVIMPKKSGREVYDAVKTLKPDTAVLFMSGYTADVIHKKGVFEEGMEFLSKPVSPFDLLRKIRELLDRRKGRG